MTRMLTIRSILLLALVLRLLWLLVVGIDPVSDSVMYDSFARSIAEGPGYAYPNGSLTAYWPVGASAIYGALYWTFGYNHLAVGVFNLLIGVGIVYLSWKVAQHYFDEGVAEVGALLLAIWPLLIQFTTVLASELIFIFLMLCAVWAFVQERILGMNKAVLFGALIGLGCYIRPAMLPLLIILPLLEVIANRNYLKGLTFVAVAGVCAILVLAPWSYRNTQLFGEFTSVSTNFGPNLWMGNNPDSQGGWMEFPKDHNFDSEKDRDNSLQSEAIEFIIANPNRYFELATNRLVMSFSRETIGVVWNANGIRSAFGDGSLHWLKLLTTLFWLAALFCAVVGVLMFLAKYFWRSIFFPPMVMAAYLLCVPILIVGQDRYHMPLIPIVAWFASYVVLVAQEIYRSRALSRPS